MKLQYKLTPFQKLQFKFMCLVVIYIRHNNNKSHPRHLDKSLDIHKATEKMGEEFEKFEVD